MVSAENPKMHSQPMRMTALESDHISETETAHTVGLSPFIGERLRKVEWFALG